MIMKSSSLVLTQLCQRSDSLRCKGDQNELLEINRRQTECLRMLEEEYRKLEDDHQRLQSQYEDIEKKRNS